VKAFIEGTENDNDGAESRMQQKNGTAKENNMEKSNRNGLEINISALNHKISALKNKK
jgi:hypothetical protein